MGGGEGSGDYACTNSSSDANRARGSGLAVPVCMLENLVFAEDMSVKLIRYAGASGPAWGLLLQEDRVAPLDDDGGSPPLSFEAVFERARSISAGRTESRAPAPLATLALLAPVHPAATVYCIGLNYKAHVAEAGRELPPYPSVFLRRHASLVGHGAPLQRPQASEQLDFEGELALVIGRGGRAITEADATAHIAAYTCFNDGSVRDYQRHSLAAGKNFERSGACGPWLVSADSIADPARLTLTTHVNGVEMQRASTGELIYPIATLVSYVSRFARLRPGDVIATGTPEGVGALRSPPRWLVAGDRVAVAITGIGTLDNPVVAGESGQGGADD